MQVISVHICVWWPPVRRALSNVRALTSSTLSISVAESAVTRVNVDKKLSSTNGNRVWVIEILGKTGCRRIQNLIKAQMIEALRYTNNHIVI